MLEWVAACARVFGRIDINLLIFQCSFYKKKKAIRQNLDKVAERAIMFYNR